MNRLAFATATLLMLSACKGFPYFWKPESNGAVARPPCTEGTTEGDTGTPPRAVLEFQNPRYDGETVSGRLLLGMEEGTLCIDRRLVERIALSVKDVSDCATGQPVDYMVVDVIAPRPREEDVLVLTPGYWYGKDIRLGLFNEKLSGQPGPECIEADLRFHALGGKVAGQRHLRVTRAPQPPRREGVREGVKELE